ncbi:MAG TPA: sigma-70 family RNA polymerase sigma factor [Streptosporangiaceae bacterium]|nr:sigma-70 family RNA polymerase sigma factor [Streptosporangiaceae bacterium]
MAEEAAGATSPSGHDWPDSAALAALRSGDEQAMAALVRAWSPMMLRMARAQLSDAGSADDVVQDAWLVVLNGLDRFEGRSMLRTWVLGIVMNLARRTATKDRRALPFSATWRAERDELRQPAVDPSRFGADGRWIVPPLRWDILPEHAVSAAELRRVVDDAITELPVRQRAVITARDVLGLPGDEVAALFGLSEANQRVLLHRARSRTRAGIEHYMSSTHSQQAPEAAAAAAPRPPARRARPATPKPDQPVVCRQLVELVDDYLQRQLDLATRQRVEAHLSVCETCAGYVTQVQRLLDVTGQLIDAVPDTTLQRFVAALRADHVRHASRDTVLRRSTGRT